MTQNSEWITKKEEVEKTCMRYYKHGILIKKNEGNDG